MNALKSLFFQIEDAANRAQDQAHDGGNLTYIRDRMNQIEEALHRIKLWLAKPEIETAEYPKLP